MVEVESGLSNEEKKRERFPQVSKHFPVRPMWLTSQPANIPGGAQSPGDSRDDPEVPGWL